MSARNSWRISSSRRQYFSVVAGSPARHGVRCSPSKPWTFNACKGWEGAVYNEVQTQDRTKVKPCCEHASMRFTWDWKGIPCADCCWGCCGACWYAWLMGACCPGQYVCVPGAAGAEGMPFMPWPMYVCTRQLHVGLSICAGWSTLSCQHQEKGNPHKDNTTWMHAPQAAIHSMSTHVEPGLWNLTCAGC